MKMNEKILNALDGVPGSAHDLTPEELKEFSRLKTRLQTLKETSSMSSDTGYFETLIPRFRERLDSAVPQKLSAFSLSPLEILRLSAGAVLPVILVFYLVQSQGVQVDNYSGGTLPEVSDYSRLQTIEEMAVESPAEITETVNNSFREIISAGSDDLHLIMRESPATEDELGQLLEDSDLDEIIAQLEKKKIL